MNISLHPKLLDPTFGIPFDVTFQIMASSEHSSRVSEEVVLGEVKGHKLILGLISPVFKNQFFGNAKDEEEIIPVRQTNKEAFEKMITYIYSKPVDWSSMTVIDLYDVVNLAEKYDVSSLMDEVKTQLVKYPLTTENLMEVATTVDEYEQFPSVTPAVLQSCARFLNSQLQSREDLLRFSAENVGAGQQATAIKLFALAQGLGEEQPNKLCDNCGETDSRCWHGQVLTSLAKMRTGIKLGPNKDSGYWNHREGRVFTVDSVNPTRKEVGVKDSDSADPDTKNCYMINHPTFGYMFIFKCK